MLAKLGWRLCSEKDILWSKYTIGTTTLERLSHKHGSSNAWRGIVVVAGILQAEVRAYVYNGGKNMFWRDVWLGDTSLLEQTTRPLAALTSFKMTKDYWEYGRGWKWEDLEGMLPIQIQTY